MRRRRARRRWRRTVLRGSSGAGRCLRGEVFDGEPQLDSGTIRPAVVGVLARKCIDWCRGRLCAVMNAWWRQLEPQVSHGLGADEAEMCGAPIRRSVRGFQRAAARAGV